MKLVFKYLKGSYFTLCLSVIACVLGAFFKLSTSLVVSYVLDHVIDTKEISNPLINILDILVGTSDYIKDNYIKIIFIVLLISIGYSICFFSRIYFQTVTSENLVRRLRVDLYKHIQKLPYEYHVKSQTGELVQKCTTDVDMIRRFFAGQFQEIISSLSLVIIAIAILLSINVSLTIFAVALMPILFVFAFLFFKKVQKVFKDSDEAEGELTSYVQEALSGIRVIKAFNTEVKELNKFTELNNTFKNSVIKLINVLGNYWSLSDFICILQIGIVVIMGVLYTNDGQISAGDFFIFFSYESMIVWPVRQIGRLLSDAGKLEVSGSRLLEILETEDESYDGGLSTEIKGELRFENVSFKYGDNQEVLSKLNFTVNKGETLAILGPTASGKSTLISLINRLYEPTSGNIYIDDINIKEYNLHHLRKNIGMVLQEPFLFSKTIYNNIKVSNQNFDDTTVQKAAKNASVHNDIINFDLGYDTVVGEKGVTLSGGQKQRIAIARTIINDCPIIVFDDSLSAVDSETDKGIRDALKQYNGNTTTIIITQRINSAMSADKVIILEDGKISDVGTHQSLINKPGLYKRIYDIQSKMIKEEV